MLVSDWEVPEMRLVEAGRALAAAGGQGGAVVSFGVGFLKTCFCVFRAQ